MLCRCCSCSFLSRIFCCKNCCCCCCCKENKNNDQAQAVVVTESNNSFFEDGSIYNGSSCYETTGVQQSYQESNTSGIFSVEQASSPSVSSVPESTRSMQNRNTKMQMSMEVKGTLNLGGIRQEVQGVINIGNQTVHQETQRSVYTINKDTVGGVNMKNIYENVHPKRNVHSTHMVNRPPAPLPRDQDTIKRSTSQSDNKKKCRTYTYVDILDTHYDFPKPTFQTEFTEPRESQLSEDYYLTPRPPLPVKTRKIKDNKDSYRSVYTPSSSISVNDTLNEIIKHKYEAFTISSDVDKNEENNSRADQINLNEIVFKEPIYEEIKMSELNKHN